MRQPLVDLDGLKREDLAWRMRVLVRAAALANKARLCKSDRAVFDLVLHQRLHLAPRQRLTVARIAQLAELSKREVSNCLRRLVARELLLIGRGSSGRCLNIMLGRPVFPKAVPKISTTRRTLNARSTIKTSLPSLRSGKEVLNPPQSEPARAPGTARAPRGGGDLAATARQRRKERSGWTSAGDVLRGSWRGLPGLFGAGGSGPPPPS